MSPITFEATPYQVGSQLILRLPKPASAKLPSRGMVMVEGAVNGAKVQLPLEPDGKGGHWMKIEKKMKTKAGESARVEIEAMEDWPDPEMPADWKAALAKNPMQRKMWDEITPIARWDWIRWIRMSANPDTRKKHIVVALSKMKAGMRRPCCFNRSACTDPEVSKGGVLLDPKE